MLTVAPVPWEPSANVTEAPLPSPVVQVSDARPFTGQEGSPASGEVPVRDIVPLKAEVLLFFRVKNPLSGFAQIVPCVLHHVTVPLAVCPLSTAPAALVTVKDVAGTTELMTNVPLFAVS